MERIEGKHNEPGLENRYVLVWAGIKTTKPKWFSRNMMFRISQLASLSTVIWHHFLNGEEFSTLYTSVTHSLRLKGLDKCTNLAEHKSCIKDWVIRDNGDLSAGWIFIVGGGSWFSLRLNAIRHFQKNRKVLGCSYSKIDKCPLYWKLFNITVNF